jgi:predicted nuclease of predicted toxin-antitoxin system
VREAVKFHLDEQVRGAIAQGLRQRGLDVTTTAGSGLRGAADEEQLAFARAAGRVLFTHDSDFLRLHKAGMPHGGIAYCRPDKLTAGDIVRALVRLAETASPEKMRGRVVFL